jgi:hypothetical protein
VSSDTSMETAHDSRGPFGSSPLASGCGESVVLKSRIHLLTTIAKIKRNIAFGVGMVKNLGSPCVSQIGGGYYFQSVGNTPFASVKNFCT